VKIPSRAFLAFDVDGQRRKKNQERQESSRGDFHYSYGAIYREEPSRINA